MDKESKIGKATRRIIVALANRTTRKIRRVAYVKRLPSIVSKLEAQAKECAAEFSGSVFGNSACLCGSPFTEELLDSAGRVAAGSFILFEEWFDIPQDILSSADRWRTDFSSRHVFNQSQYTVIAPANNVADIKVPWEYGRLQGLVPLAIAARSTGDTRFIESFREIVDSFKEANPLGMGVQWVCTMEVGIRAFNLLAAYEIIRQELPEGDELHQTVAVLSLWHAEHIEANLETSARLQENNHYVADLLGLAVVAACYPMSPKARKWGKYVQKELERSAKKQILDDGCCFERSTRYSRLVGEMLYYAGKTLAGSPHALSDAYWERLARMGRFLETATDASGHSQQIGDNDSGRVMPLSTERYNDLRLLGRLVLRERGILTEIEPAYFAEESLFYGARERFDSLPSWESGLRVFDNAGMTFAKIQDYSLGFYAIDGFVDNAEAGHTHNDKLSVTLEIDGVPILVDSGSGHYTKDTELRNALRATKQHSTLWFEGMEQNEYRGLFGFARMGGATAVSAKDEGRIKISGATNCWVKRAACKHRREVILDRDGVLIKDELEGAQKSTKAMRSFVLSPSVMVFKCDDRTVKIESAGTKVTFQSNAKVLLRRGLYSGHYGVVESTYIVDSPYVPAAVNMVRIKRDD